jgi:hypothetical protein
MERGATRPVGLLADGVDGFFAVGLCREADEGNVQGRVITGRRSQ